MTKPEILEIVKLMLQDWETSFESKDKSIVNIYKCEYGFCWYIVSYLFKNKLDSDLEEVIINELSKDKIQENLFGNFWYQKFYLSWNIETLLPRIDHLKRTIARLEKEIADDTKIEFFEWAESFFSNQENLNKHLQRTLLYESYSKTCKGFTLTASKFKQAFFEFCELKGYEFNPVEMCNSQSRIVKPIITEDNKRIVVEHYYIKNKK